MADPQDPRNSDARCCSDENRLSVWKIDYVSLLNEVIGDLERTPAELLADGLPHIWRDRYVQMVLRETTMPAFKRQGRSAQSDNRSKAHRRQRPIFAAKAHAG